jgi:HPr kinase/phosphorylase
MTRPDPFIHASAVVIGEAGVLIRGPSGSGKSTLSRRLIGEARRRGLFAALIGDDRIAVAATHGRIIARSHRAIAGAIEVFGLGIATTHGEDAALVRLVVDVTTTIPDRFPALHDQTVEIAGLVLPRMICRARDEDLVLVALGMDQFSRCEPT